MTATMATARPSVRLASERAGQVLVQLALPRGRRLLLRVQRAVVDLLDLGGDPHDGVAPRHNLAPQKAVAIDRGRAVEQRRVACQYSSS